MPIRIRSTSLGDDEPDFCARYGGAGRRPRPCPYCSEYGSHHANCPNHPGDDGGDTEQDEPTISTPTGQAGSRAR